MGVVEIGPQQSRLAPEGVKKSHFHPHPVPPPSRGREFLLLFQHFYPLHASA